MKIDYDIELVIKNSAKGVRRINYKATIKEGPRNMCICQLFFNVYKKYQKRSEKTSSSLCGTHEKTGRRKDLFNVFELCEKKIRLRQQP